MVEPNPPNLSLRAALDLGSNSFHLVIAGVNQGEVRLRDKISEKVQLGAGIGPDNRINAEAQTRALECLARYAERLQGIPASSVRVVGTNALRQAKNSKEFIAKAEQTLGYEIDIIGGREEARLVYLGVAHTLADDAGQRLVIDIGGGSTEFIIGERFETQLTESLHMGCVSYALRFFDSEINETQFNRAILAAKQQLASIQDDLAEAGWITCVGSSGTIRAITNLLVHQGKVDEHVQLGHLYDLREQVLQFSRREAIEMDGLSPLRAPVLPSGLAILIAIFETLGIKSMQYSTGALREGLLYDNLGRIDHEDVRDRTVKAMALRYHVNFTRAERIKNTALDLLDLLGVDSLPHTNLAPYLGWAADLYQIGLSVSHSNFHRHGAYLIKYSDLPGFTNKEQAFLAALVKNHRRSFKKLKKDSDLYFMRSDYNTLSLCLRIAILIQRAHLDFEVQIMRFQAVKSGYELALEPNWREQYRLLETDLEQEVEILSEAGIQLSLI